MSDEPTSSNAAAIPHPQQITDEDDIDNAVSSAAKLAELRKRNRQSFNRMRVHLLDDLVRNLDVLVYAQLSAIYYMDCHIIRFLIRGIVQFMYLSPKPALFPSPPKPEPYVGAILGSNLLCLILHIFSQAPSASEATRFYMHGGLIIDFVGQRGPTSKLLLIVLDLFVVMLQLIHLSAHVSRVKLVDELPSRTRSAPAVPAQDLDSEERGIRRSVEIAQEQVQEGIELQSLNQNGRTVETASSSLDDIDAEGPRPESVLFDAFRNGQIVLADLNLTKTLKEQVIRFHKTPPEVRRNALSAHLAGRLVGLRLLRGRAMNG